MQNNDQNKNTGLFFPGTPSRHGYLNFIERRRRFYLHQMFLMYVAHSNYEDFDTIEFDKMKLPPAQNVLGFAIEDIVGMDHIPACFSPAPKPFTHLFS